MGTMLKPSTHKVAGWSHFLIVAPASGGFLQRASNEARAKSVAILVEISRPHLLCTSISRRTFNTYVAPDTG